MTISIAVDAMGGDVGVGVTVPAALAFSSCTGHPPDSCRPARSH